MTLLSSLMLLATYCSANKIVSVHDDKAILIEPNDSTTILSVSYQDSSWACFRVRKYKELGMRLADAKICKAKLETAESNDSVLVLLKEEVSRQDSIVALKDSVISSDSTTIAYRDSIIVKKDSIIANREEVIKLAEDAQMGIIEVLGYAAISLIAGFLFGLPL